MQVIIISSNNKTHKHWHFSRTKLVGMAVLLLAVITISLYGFSRWHDERTAGTLTSLSELHLSDTQSLLDNELAVFDEEISAQFYARQLGGLQAETLRLKMLSERLAQAAGIDIDAFDLEHAPPLGGPEQDGEPLSSDALDNGIEKLSLALEEQNQNLARLEHYLITQDRLVAGFPDGEPVKDGWVSSFYGYRLDPFNGKKTFHKGVDIAAKTGTAVVAAADGIVSWVEQSPSYGGLVEVDHGNGYVTRYAHNKTLKVEKGQRVSKGDVLALIGSTGRSTGPHLHYEVLRDGLNINPSSLLK